MTADAAGKQLAQFLFTLAFLPYDAYVSLDAITRTLARVFWTKKKLLEWKTASSAERGAQAGLAGFFHTMCVAPAIGLAAMLLVMVCRPDSLVVVLPLVALWSISPVIAWWLSRPLAKPPIRLSDEQRVFLEKLSRRTWRFFETFVTAEENWLPPTITRSTPTRSSPRAPARPTSAWPCWPICRPATLVIARPANSSTAHGRRWTRCRVSTAIAATSTTGTTPVRSSRFVRGTFRPLIAATFSAICWYCESVCWS